MILPTKKEFENNFEQQIYFVFDDPYNEIGVFALKCKLDSLLKSI
ncbi:hypothetical protein [Mycoplasma sp. 'Moose RK']|nr:hypothetical protein [Mycoplasma sp. 'Moose RK']